MIDGYQYPPFGFSRFLLLYLPIIIEFIGGLYVVLCTWVIIIRLVNTICDVPTTLIFIVGSLELLLNSFLLKIHPIYDSSLLQIQ